MSGGALHAALAQAPGDRGVAVLLRHAERGPLPEGAPGDEVPLTEAGLAAARALGGALGGRVRSVHTSPVWRCVQTARAIAEGAGCPGPLARSALLGAPGAFVADPAVAWEAFLAQPFGVLMDRLARGGAVAGFHALDLATRTLVDDLLRTATLPGLHVHVSHDSVVGLAFHHLLGRRAWTGWPGFLDGGVVWQEGVGVCVAWGADEGVNAAEGGGAGPGRRARWEHPRRGDA